MSKNVRRSYDRTEPACAVCRTRHGHATGSGGFVSVTAAHRRHGVSSRPTWPYIVVNKLNNG